MNKHSKMVNRTVDNRQYHMTREQSSDTEWSTEWILSGMLNGTRYRLSIDKNQKECNLCIVV